MVATSNFIALMQGRYIPICAYLRLRRLLCLRLCYGHGYSYRIGLLATQSQCIVYVVGCVGL